MVIGLSITSCKYSGNYDFIEKDEVVNSLQIYYSHVKLIHVNGSESSFTLDEYGEYFYYSYNCFSMFFPMLYWFRILRKCQCYRFY